MDLKPQSDIINENFEYLDVTKADRLEIPDISNFVTKEELITKQNVISDLDAIRSNANAGKIASNTIATYGDIVTHNANEFATTNALSQGLESKQDIINDLASIRDGASKGATALQNVPSNYVTNTDYASSSTGGVIRIKSDYGVSIDSTGYIYSPSKTLEAYKSSDNALFIGKGTLENIKESLVTSVGDTKYQPIISDLDEIRTNASTGAGLSTQVESNTQRIEDLTTARIPDVIYRGTPKITGGQLSNFSTVNYAIFPFEDISRGLPFDIYFSFTTDNDVTTQQNIVDSHFGIALAIQNSKGVMALSSNGTSWDIGTATGTNTILPNTTYYVKYSWTGTEYTASLSTNDKSYIPDMTLASNKSPYKTTIYIGGNEGLFGAGSAHPFKGIINFTKSRVDVNGITVWEGMADVGIASRANVSLSNLDELGEKRFTDKQDVITDLETIRAGASKGATALQTIPIAKANVVGGVAGGNWLTVNQTTGKMECGELTKAQYDSALGYTFISKTTLNNVLVTKQDVIPDLDTYVKNTDYAGADKAGLIKASPAYGNAVSSGGYLMGYTRTLDKYNSDATGLFITKGTLENIKESLVTSVGDGKYAKADELNNPFSLFDCKFADHLLNNASWLRADTFEWNSGDVYVDAYNLLVEEFNNGYEEWIEGIGNCRRTPRGFKIFASWAEEEILNKYNTDGIAWFYILDTENKRFKLPRTKWGFKGVRDVVGNPIDEKLPNITGQLNSWRGVGKTDIGTIAGQASGAFGRITGTQPYHLTDSSGSSNGTGGVTFDASRSSSTYQDNAPVQERGTQMYLYFYVGETVQNANLIDAGRIQEQLTTKVDVASSWGFPSKRYIDLTLGASGTTYTAPANGWIFFRRRSSGGNQFIAIANSIYSTVGFSAGENNSVGLIFPVRKGTTYQIDYNMPSHEYFRFVYAEGAN